MPRCPWRKTQRKGRKSTPSPKVRHLQEKFFVYSNFPQFRNCSHSYLQKLTLACNTPWTNSTKKQQVRRWNGWRKHSVDSGGLMQRNLTSNQAKKMLIEEIQCCFARQSAASKTTADLGANMLIGGWDRVVRTCSLHLPCGTTVKCPAQLCTLCKPLSVICLRGGLSRLLIFTPCCRRHSSPSFLFCSSRAVGCFRGCTGSTCFSTFH